MLDTNAAAKLLNKAIDVVFMRRDEVSENKLAAFFEKVPISSGLSYTVTSAGRSLTMPVQNEDTEALPYVAPVTGFDKTFTLINYRSGIRVTSTILKADRFSKVMQMTTGQLKSGLRKDEYMRAAIINGSFTGTAGADSLPLVDDSHPQENPEAGTWDNEGTGALTGPNLHALRLLARKMTNDQGYPDQVVPVTLLVPPDLEQKALELTGEGMGKPETALNEANVMLTKFTVTVSPYLSSATAYWIFGDRMGEDKGLMEVTLEDWNIKDNSPANADIILDKRIKAIKAFGYTTSRNTFGSAGT
jgi:hypothetical protein